MADNNFFVKKGLHLEGQASTPSNPVDGDIYFNAVTGTYSLFQGGFWSDYQSKAEIPGQSVISSSVLNSTVVISSIVQITGAPSTSTTVTGLTASADSKSVTLLNSSNQTVILSNEDSSETNAANRITCPNSTSVIISTGFSARLMYDSNFQRWLVINQVSTPSSGVTNYIPEGDAESTLIGVLYNNSSVAPSGSTPGLGGTPTNSLAFTTVAGNVLAGNQSFLYTPGGLGNGVSYDFTINNEDKNSTLIVPFSYYIVSGTYYTGDLTVYIYDKINNNLITPYNYQIPTQTGYQTNIAVFNTAGNSNSYRLCIHQATANNSYTLSFELAVNTRTLSYTPLVKSPAYAGFIQEWGGSSDPANGGWFVCDGRSLSTTAYPDLFNNIGYNFGGSGASFNIPDLRGRFIRGSDNMGTGAAYRDPGGRSAMNPGGATGTTVGSIQSDQFQGHLHAALSGTFLYVTPGGVFSSGTSGNQGNGNYNVTGTPVSDGGDGSPRYGSETRPLNANLNYVIKVYNDQIVNVVEDIIPYSSEVGMLLPGAMTTPPVDFLAANGASVLVSQYPELFNVIGYTYGGSGANFTLPTVSTVGALHYFIRYRSAQLPTSTLTSVAGISAVAANTGINSTTSSGVATLSLSGPSTYAIPSTVIDWSQLGIIGGVYTQTVSSSTTFSFSNQVAGQTIVVRLTMSGSPTVSWTGVKWPGGSAPTATANGTDVITLIYDGVNTYGVSAQNFS